MSNPSNASIPIFIPGTPSTNPTDANFTGVLNSTRVLPVPIPSDQVAPYGGTADRPLWFYNRTNADVDIVCGTSNWTIRKSCCPRSIGIMNGDSDAGANCRMYDRPANKEYWMNCTKQLGEEYGVPDVQSACWPLQWFMGNRTEQRRTQLAEMITNDGQCWTVSEASGPNNYTYAGNNYTDVCCERAGGRVDGHMSAVPGMGDKRENRSNWVGLQCATQDRGKQDAFLKCADEYTWGVCDYRSGTVGGAQISLLLLAAAASLALVV